MGKGNSGQCEKGGDRKEGEKVDMEEGECSVGIRCTGLFGYEKGF